MGSQYPLNRLVIEWKNSTPDNVALAFTDETEVANYYGATSLEAGEASVFFGPNDKWGLQGATMYFIRWSYQQRPHLLGINLAPAGLAALQRVNGELDIEFHGVYYHAPVNLAGVTSFTQAAQLLTTDFNTHLPVLADAEASIAPVSSGFTGSVNAAHLTVTGATPDQIKIGAVISGKGVSSVGTNSGSPVQVTEQINGTPGGDGVYSVFAYGGNTPVESLTESYGILTQGAHKPWDFGQIATGDTLVAYPENIAAKTAVIQDLGDGRWLVNNAQTVASETIGFRATPLQVYLDWNDYPIIGKTQNNDFFDIAPGGLFGFNNEPSSISYAWSPAGDPTATELGLTQAAGAIDTGEGGLPTTVNQFMNYVLHNVTDHFSTIMTNLPAQDTVFEQWAASPAGNGYTFLTDNYTPAGGMILTASVTDLLVKP